MPFEIADGPFGKLLFLADVIHVIVDDLDGLVHVTGNLKGGELDPLSMMPQIYDLGTGLFLPPTSMITCIWGCRCTYISR